MTDRMRVLCADDEPLALDTLKGLVEADPSLDLVAACHDGDEALRSARELQPDLLILDVHMPGRTGLEVVHGLAEDQRPLVVFATAHDDHAVAAFELHAVDYLLKPFDDERFAKALARARERRAQEGPGPGQERLDRALEATEERLVALPRDGRVDYVRPQEIEWIEAADQYVELHLESGRTELLRASLGQLEKRLTADGFLRVHRSALVAMRAARRLESLPTGTGKLHLASGAVVPVARTRLAVVRRRLASV